MTHNIDRFHRHTVEVPVPLTRLRRVRPVPTRGAARVARGLTATTVCALLTYAGHTTVGGACPEPWLLAVSVLPLTGLMVALADRRRGPLTILAVVGGSQLAVHGTLQLLGTAHPPSAGAVMPGMSTMPDVSAMPGMPAIPGMSGMTGMPHAYPPPVLGAHPLLMLAAHGLVTLVTAALLSGAEDAVFTALAPLARVLPRVIAPPRPPCRPTRPAPVPVEPRDARPREALGRRLHPRRGPPKPVPAAR
jgi:hypothetical protein